MYVPQQSRVGIFPPARDGNVPPAAVAGTRGGHHHGVAAIGKQLRARGWIIRRFEPANHGRGNIADLCATAETSSARGRATSTSRGVRSCNSKFGGLHDRIGMEAGAHRTVFQNIGQRHQGHALMVRHVTRARRLRPGLREPASSCNPALRRSRSVPCPPALAMRLKFSSAAEGKIMAASAVAYGEMTMSSLRPRFSPKPGTPKPEY